MPEIRPNAAVIRVCSPFLREPIRRGRTMSRVRCASGGSATPSGADRGTSAGPTWRSDRRPGIQRSGGSTAWWLKARRPTRCSISRRIAIAIIELRPSSMNGRSVSSSDPWCAARERGWPGSSRRAGCGRRRRASVDQTAAAEADARRAGGRGSSPSARHRHHHRLCNIVAVQVLPSCESFIGRELTLTRAAQLVGDDWCVGGEAETPPGRPIEADAVAACRFRARASASK